VVATETVAVEFSDRSVTKSLGGKQFTCIFVSAAATDVIAAAGLDRGLQSNTHKEQASFQTQAATKNYSL
jgi:hypothetical protein